MEPAATAVAGAFFGKRLLVPLCGRSDGGFRIQAEEPAARVMGFVPAHSTSMANEKLRQQIAFEATRLMYRRHESEYFRAKIKAARQICRNRVKPKDLPSNREIRDQIQLFARLNEGESRLDNLRAMRLESRLQDDAAASVHAARVIGSVLTGHVRKGSDIDIHLLSDSLELVTGTLDDEGIVYDVEHKRVRKHGEERVFTHIHVPDRFPFELTLYAAANLAHYVFKSSITGKPIERASIAELEQFLAHEYPELSLEEGLAAEEDHVDRFQVYRALLLPLEHVTESKKHHPEGDALYHSLQVFDLGARPAPLRRRISIGGAAPRRGEGDRSVRSPSPWGWKHCSYITERTRWFIEHHMEAHGVHDGTLGVRARRRLEESEDFEELLLLGECDRAGRVAGVSAPDLDDALESIRELARTCG